VGTFTTGEGFAAVVPMHAPAMLHVATALIGPADVEDAVQEAAMRAWQAWATLRNPDAARPWLLRITVNVCRGWRRGLKGRQQAQLQPLPDDDEPSLALLAFDLGTSDHTGALDLRAAVNALPVELQTVVALRFYVGLDATEIGEALSIPAGTIRSRLHRALLQLREHLTPHRAARSIPLDTEARP
jgi:RNA polymerase sigma factor (sigma-70 family)